MKNTTKNNAPSKTELDAATAERVLKTDLSNILSKARSGKPLSKHERDLIESHADAEQQGKTETAATWPQWADSIAEAERITSISRQSLHDWKRQKCPAFKSNGKIELHQLQEWIKSNNKKAVPSSSRIESQRARVLRAQADKYEFENAVRRGEFVKISDLVTEGTATLAQIQELTYQKLQNEMPMAVAGMDIPQSRIYGTRLAGELIKQWSGLFKKWKI
jgi:hypothetical protein